MKKTSIKLITSAALACAPGTVLAHQGHGSPNVALHNMEHGLVLLGSFVLLAIAMAVYRRANRQDVDG